jgi:hypothetical protein
MKRNPYMVMVAIVAIAAMAAVGCGGVSGHTYQAGGGLMQIEFQSGGKANVSMGPTKTPCTYTESGKAVTVTCMGEKAEFTMNSDGSLVPAGNAQGMGTLTKVK